VRYAEDTMRLELVCAMLATATVNGQTASGSITGTAVDSEGAPIPNATVSILSPVELATTSDSAGEFLIAKLATGTYKLRIHASGFVTKGLEASVAGWKKTTLGHVVLEVKVPPCVGKLRRPQISETTPAVSIKPTLSGNTRGETYGALKYLTVTLLLAGTSSVIATTGTDETGEFRFEDVEPGVYDVAVSFGSDTFSEEETFAKVRNLRARKGHELEVRLTWEQPPGQICL
jgi:Carboxypeptidase regulatory-like domain